MAQLCCAATHTYAIRTAELFELSLDVRGQSVRDDVQVLIGNQSEADGSRNDARYHRSISASRARADRDAVDRKTRQPPSSHQSFYRLTASSTVLHLRNLRIHRSFRRRDGPNGVVEGRQQYAFPLCQSR